MTGQNRKRFQSGLHGEAKGKGWHLVVGQIKLQALDAMHGKKTTPEAAGSSAFVSFDTIFTSAGAALLVRVRSLRSILFGLACLLEDLDKIYPHAHAEVVAVERVEPKAKCVEVRCRPFLRFLDRVWTEGLVSMVPR